MKKLNANIPDERNEIIENILLDFEEMKVGQHQLISTGNLFGKQPRTYMITRLQEWEFRRK